MKKSVSKLVVFAFPLCFIVCCVLLPGKTTGQSGTDRGSVDVVELAQAAQDLLPQNGTPVQCTTPVTFDAGAPGWTVQPVAGPALWHVANNVCRANFSGHSVPATMYYGRDSDCTFIEGVRSASNLISPEIMVPTGLQFTILNFNYLLQIEGGSFDLVFVDVSTNGGATWTQILSKTNLLNDGQWHNAARDISSIARGAASIRVRFRFDTIDEIINRTIGWHIDDLQLCQSLLACIRDDVNSHFLTFNVATGDYEFRDCAKNIFLSGKGAIRTSFCKLELSDSGPDPKHPDRLVTVQFNRCTRTATATVITPTGQMFNLNDSGIDGDVCACQPQ